MKETMKDVNVSVPYELFKSMEFQIEAIKKDAAYICDGLLYNYPNCKVIVGVEADVKELINKANFAIETREWMESDLKQIKEANQDLTNRLRYAQIEIEELKTQLKEANKSKWPWQKS